MENDTGDESLAALSGQVEVIRKVNEAQKRQESFIPVPGYAPGNRVVPGTPENSQMLADAFNDESTRELFQHATSAIEHVRKYNALKKDWDTKAQSIRDKSQMAVGSPAFAVMQAEQEKLEKEKPKLSPYGSWLAGMGSNPNEIVTELAKRNDKANFYFQKYTELGIDKLISQNKGVLEDPVGLAELMKANGYFDPNTDEENFFRENANNSYSQRFGHSVWGKIKGTYDAELLRSGFGPRSFHFQMAAGRKLDPNSAKDQTDYVEYWDFSKTQEGGSFLENAGHALAGVTEDFLKSVFRTGAALDPRGNNIEYEFDGDFIDPVGPNLILKEKFLRQWRNLNKQFQDGKLGQTQDLFWGYRKFVDKNKTATQVDDIFDIEDPGVRKEVPVEMKEFLETFREIRSKGGIRHDVYGLAAATSFADGALQLTAGFALMAMSTDPDGIVTEGMSHMPFYRDKVRGDDELLTLKFKRAGEERVMTREALKTRMRMLNHAYEWHNKAEIWRDSGLISPEHLYDRELAQAAAGWADVSLLLGPGRKIAEQMFKATAGKAIPALELAQRIQKRYMTTVFNIEEAVRKGVKLPDELTNAIKAVQEESKAAGVAISESDAIKKIYDGHPVVIDPKTGAKVALDATQLYTIAKKVASAVDNTQAVRDQLARLAIEGRRIPQYSNKSYATMKKIKDWLITSGDATLDWSKVPTQQIYEFINNSGINIPGKVVSSGEMAALKKEVGLSWRQFDPHDIAGWSRSATLPVEFGLNARYWTWRGIGTGFQWIGGVGQRFLNIVSTYGPDQTSTAVTVRNAAKLGQENMGVGVAQAPWYKAWTIAHAAPAIAKFVGGIGETMKNIAEYKIYAAKLGGTKSGSALLAMYKDTSEQILMLETQIAAAAKNPAYMAKTDVEKLIKKKEELIGKALWAKQTHAWTNNAFVSGTLGVMKNGLIHGLYNESLMYMADSRNPGSGFGMTLGLTGINKTIHAGFVRQFTSNAGIKEKVNDSQVEFVGHLAEKFEFNENQKRRWIELYMAEAQKAQEIAAQKGEEIGVRYWAHSLEAINGLFRTRAAVELHDAGVIEGMHALFRDTQLRENPEFAQHVRNEFIAEANKLGLEGEEAVTYANKKVEAYTKYNAVQARKLQISNEVANLEKERESTAATANKELFALQQAATTMLQSIGLSAENVRTEMVTGAHGETAKLTVNGVEISELDSTAPLALRTKALEKIAIIRSELHNINQRKVQAEATVRRINEKLQSLKNEEAAINSYDVTYSYRPGEVVVDEVSGTRMTSYKDGITIWEQDQGNGEWSTKIILDRKKFNLETAWEETIHAFTYTENAHRGVAMFNQAIFGHWQVDPNDATKFINAKLNPKTLAMEEMPAQISGDVETNIELLTRFAESYSDGLSAQEKMVFMAKYRAGIDAFRRNPTDLRKIEPVMLELIADVYKFRKAMSSPFTSRLESTPSSPVGTFEAGPNVVGVKAPRLWQKFASGQLTMFELALEGRELNAKELGLGLDPSDLTVEQDRMQKILIASGNFMRLFGLGGTFDTVNRNALKAKAVQLGLIQDKPASWWNDKTKENQTLFSNRNMYDADGNIVAVPDELVRAVSTIVNDTRGHGSELRRNAFPTEEQIKDSESSTDPNDVAARVQWAFSTGRRSWINAAGQFKRPFWELMRVEHEPIREFFRAVVSDTNKKGETYGLRVQRIGQGGYAIAGTPNLEQSAAIRSYFKEKILKNKQAGDVPTTYDNMLLFMNSMAEGNKFDPKATRPGELLAFNATYRPVWASKELTDGDSSRRYEKGYSRDLNFVPFAMIIKDTSFDFEGEMMEKTHKNGKPVLDKNGNPIAETLPQVFFWNLDLDSLERRRIRAMKGLLTDGNGVPYFEKGEIFKLFGKDFNLYDEAQRIAFANWSTAGSFDKNTKEYGPPQRTWMALLPLTKNSRGQTSEQLAKTWAMAIQRIVGFPTNNFRELTLLEREVLTKKSGDRDLTPEELRQKKAELKELRSKNPEASSDVDAALAKAGAKVGRNEFGIADDLHSLDSSFFLLRADRIDGIAQPLLDGNGIPAKLSFSNWGALAGSISWSTNNWSQIPKEGVSKITAGYNLSGAVFHNGWTHSSGYQVFLMQDRSEKGGRLSKKKFVVFDSQRRVVNQFNITDLNDAFKVAADHSEQNPQIPITGNRYEEAMIEQGWLPKGMNVAGFMRDRFVNGDGVWQLQRMSKGGLYELVHVPTGFIIAEKLNITEENPKLPAIKLDDVNAAILEARTNNTIIARVNAEKYKQLKSEGIHEYRLVPEVNQKGEMKNVQVPFAINNNAYWSIKRMLVHGTKNSAGFGLAKANEILEQMKTELGAEVVERDPVAVIKWFENWSTEFERSLSPAELERMSNQAKLEAEKEAVDEAHKYALLRGQKLIFEKPKPYTKATMVNKEGKVPPEWLDANGQLTAEMQKYFADKYAEELASWEMQERARKGISATEVEGETLNEEGQWVGKDNDLQINYNSLLREIGVGIRQLKEDTANLTQQAKTRIQGQALDLESQDLITKIAKLRNEATALGEQAKSQWLVNQFGYMIQGTFFKEPKMPLGIEMTIGKIGLFSNRAAEGSNWVFQKPSQLPKTKFIAYSPYGVIIGTYGSVDAANEAIMDYELNRTAEDNKREIQLKELAKPGSTGYVPASKNIYQEYIRALDKRPK